jgi:hypothetical protein
MRMPNRKPYLTAAVVSAVVLASIVTIVMHKSRDDQVPEMTRSAAHYMGVEPGWLQQWGLICSKAESKHEISQADFDFVNNSFDIPEKRKDNLVIFAHLSKGTPFRDRAVNLAQIAATPQNDVFVRLQAVRVLKHFDVPGWQDLAKPLIDDEKTRQYAIDQFPEVARPR